MIDPRLVASLASVWLPGARSLLTSQAVLEVGVSMCSGEAHSRIKAHQWAWDRAKVAGGATGQD